MLLSPLQARYEKRGEGGGVLSALGPIRKAGWVWVWVCVLYTSGTIRKVGGLLSRRRGGTLFDSFNNEEYAL